MPCEGIGVASGVASFHVCERRLGNKGTQTHVVSFLLEECELLLGHREFGAYALETFTDINEAALEDRPRHAQGVYGRRSTARRAGSSK